MASSYASGGSSTSTKTTSTTDTPPPATRVVFWDPDHADQYIQLREPSPWLRGKLADKRVPGLMEVKVPGATRKVDVQSPPSKGGAKIIVKGWSPSDVQIKVTMWTNEQFEAWQELKPLIRVDGTSTNAVPILHPVAEESSVSSVVIKKVSGLEDGSIPGTKVVTIDATDATTQKNTGTGTAKGGASSQMLVWFELYKSYVVGIKANSGGGGYWLTWSTWIMQNGHPELCGPNPPGYAAWAPPGMP